jgi:hypothetical protein
MSKDVTDCGGLDEGKYQLYHTKKKSKKEKVLISAVVCPATTPLRFDEVAGADQRCVRLLYVSSLILHTCFPYPGVRP